MTLPKDSIVYREHERVKGPEGYGWGVDLGVGVTGFANPEGGIRPSVLISLDGGALSLVVHVSTATARLFGERLIKAAGEVERVDAAPNATHESNDGILAGGHSPSADEQSCGVPAAD